MSHQLLQQPYLENIDSVVFGYAINTGKDNPSQDLVFDNCISKKEKKQLRIQQAQLKSQAWSKKNFKRNKMSEKICSKVLS